MKNWEIAENGVCVEYIVSYVILNLQGVNINSTYYVLKNIYYPRACGAKKIFL